MGDEPSEEAIGCAQCRPETAPRRADELPTTWEPFRIAHDWGMGGLLKPWLEPLFRCPACGTTWRAVFDQYQGYYMHLEALEPALVAALARPADRSGVQALLAVKSTPKTLLLAIADSTDHAFDVSPTIRRRLLRAAGVDRNRAKPVRRRIRRE